MPFFFYFIDSYSNVYQRPNIESFLKARLYAYLRFIILMTLFLMLVSVICETFEIKPPSALETKIYD